MDSNGIATQFQSLLQSRYGEQAVAPQDLKDLINLIVLEVKKAVVTGTITGTSPSGPVTGTFTSTLVS